MKAKEKSKRVGYVFSGDTVRRLEELAAIDSPLYTGRPATWIVEYAIHELHRRVIGDKKEVA